jgi:hypothetical protein
LEVEGVRLEAKEKLESKNGNPENTSAYCQAWYDKLHKPYMVVYKLVFLSLDPQTFNLKLR